MTWVRVESNEIIHTVDRMTSRDPVWPEQVVTEDVEQFETQSQPTGDTDADGNPIMEEVEVSVGWSPEPVLDENGNQVVARQQSSASVPRGWEMDPVQMQDWGYTEVVEADRDESRPQTSGDVALVDGTPTRIWSTQTDIILSADSFIAGTTEKVTATLRLGDDIDPWPERVDVALQPDQDDAVTSDVAVEPNGYVHLDVEAPDVPGEVVVEMHGHRTSIIAKEA